MGRRGWWCNSALALTDKEIRALGPQSRRYRVSDGGGLLLEVDPAGRKYWMWRHRFPPTKDGRQQDLRLGPYPNGWGPQRFPDAAQPPGFWLALRRRLRSDPGLEAAHASPLTVRLGCYSPLRSSVSRSVCSIVSTGGVGSCGTSSGGLGSVSGPMTSTETR